MLKIKDDVDLKKLEKFGFEPRYDEKTGEIIKYTKIELPQLSGLIIKKRKSGTKRLKIVKVLRQQEKSSYMWEIIEFDTYFDTDTLYDLIQARISRESRGVKNERRRDN